MVCYPYKSPRGTYKIETIVNRTTELWSLPALEAFEFKYRSNDTHWNTYKQEHKFITTETALQGCPLGYLRTAGYGNYSFECTAINTCQSGWWMVQGGYAGVRPGSYSNTTVLNTTNTTNSTNTTVNTSNIVTTTNGTYTWYYSNSTFGWGFKTWYCSNDCYNITANLLYLNRTTYYNPFEVDHYGFCRPKLFQNQISTTTTINSDELAVRNGYIRANIHDQYKPFLDVFTNYTYPHLRNSTDNGTFNKIYCNNTLLLINIKRDRSDPFRACLKPCDTTIGDHPLMTGHIPSCEH